MVTRKGILTSDDVLLFVRYIASSGGNSGKQSGGQLGSTTFMTYRYYWRSVTPRQLETSNIAVQDSTNLFLWPLYSEMIKGQVVEADNGRWDVKITRARQWDCHLFPFHSAVLFNCQRRRDCPSSFLAFNSPL